MSKVGERERSVKTYEGVSRRQRIRPTLTALAVSRDGPKTREKSLIRCECPLSARRVNLPYICICYCHTCLPIPIFPSHSHFHFTSHHITWFLVVPIHNNLLLLVGMFIVVVVMNGISSLKLIIIIVIVIVILGWWPERIDMISVPNYKIHN
jgi:hypothetical protein